MTSSDPKSRLATTDEKGRRLYVNPLEIEGVWHQRRFLVQWVLIAIYVVIPFLHWRGERLLLLDIGRREFSLAGLHLRAHDAPLLFFVLASAGFLFFFVTAIWGRVWCGWACPQTVFIERIFRTVERWIEGPAARRRQLQKAPWSFKKVATKTFLWSAYVVLSLIITHLFLSYFVKTEDLAQMVLSDPRQNWPSFLFIAISTAIILLDFAWFREQFCLIVCPYGRFQSVLMDSGSLAVVYDSNRGEPRKNPGDCIDCHKCVEVCPTAIDIRDGVQMECIACTACIDACDQIMEKLKRPKGLIRYDSVRGLEKKPTRFWRARTVVYGGLALVTTLTLAVLISLQKDLEAQIFRASGEPPYQLLNKTSGEPQVINHFKIQLSNQSRALKRIRFLLPDELTDLPIEIVTAESPVSIKPSEIRHIDVFVRFPPHILTMGQKHVPLEVQDRFGGVKLRKDMTLVGPL